MFEEVIKILAQYTEIDSISESSMLEADLGLNSFDIVSIVSEFEDKFGIEIMDRDISKFICVKDILEYLKAHI